MSLSQRPAQISKWPFLVADAVLLACACFVAANAAQPLAAETALIVVGCVVAAAVAGVIPFLIDYGRRQEETIDSRQRALEGLAKSIHAAGEQLALVTNGVREVEELAQRHLRHAEQLPQRVQEKMAEIEAKIASARDDEREELQRELANLRGSESERLEQTAERVAKAASELAKVEALVTKQVTAARAVLAELSARTAPRAAQAEKSISEPVPDSVAVARTSVSGAAEPAAAAGTLRGPPPAEKRVVNSPAAEAALSHPALAENGPVAPATGATRLPETASGAQRVAGSAAATGAKEMAPGETAAAEPAAAAGVVKSPRADKKAAPPAPSHGPEAEGAGAAADGNGQTHDHPVKISPRKRGKPRELPAAAASTPEAAPAELSLTSEMDDIASAAEEAAPNVSISSDGATRLLVTAYIGIGNRLFIRGEGPGLSWDEGVPLQFVSIGKWRWETSDATRPIKFKILKNDQEECASLPPVALEPGRQHELTARFGA
jgi:hypothetical protein